MISARSCLRRGTQEQNLSLWRELTLHQHACRRLHCHRALPHAMDTVWRVLRCPSSCANCGKAIVPMGGQPHAAEPTSQLSAPQMLLLDVQPRHNVSFTATARAAYNSRASQARSEPAQAPAGGPLICTAAPASRKTSRLHRSSRASTQVAPRMHDPDWWVDTQPADSCYSPRVIFRACTGR